VRTYWQLLTSPDITKLDAITRPLHYNKTKRLAGKPSDKIAWATTLIAHPDILTAYEEGLQETKKEQRQPNQEQRSSNNAAKQHTPPNKGKDKIPPMAR
jgi:hypothetical protein